MALSLVLGRWKPSPPLWQPVSLLALEHGGGRSLATLALFQECQALSRVPAPSLSPWKGTLVLPVVLKLPLIPDEM